MKKIKVSMQEVVRGDRIRWTFAVSVTSRDARFLMHLSIGTRRVMRAAGEVAALSNRYKTKHCC